MQRLPDLINGFIKIIRYKVNIKIQLYFYILATNNWKLKCKNKYHFNIIKHMNYIEINLTKYVQDLYTEVYKKTA